MDYRGSENVVPIVDAEVGLNMFGVQITFVFGIRKKRVFKIKKGLAEKYWLTGLFEFKSRQKRRNPQISENEANLGIGVCNQTTRKLLLEVVEGKVFLAPKSILDYRYLSQSRLIIDSHFLLQEIELFFYSRKR